MSTYTIEIFRKTSNSGVLNYCGSFNATFPCWWDPADQVNAGTYLGCSKTFLDQKTNSKGNKREGIYWPNVPGRTGIFIHYWPGPTAELSKWSDGCTVVLESDMLKMWNDITPSNGGNVTVKVFAPVPLNYQDKWGTYPTD